MPKTLNSVIKSNIYKISQEPTFISWINDNPPKEGDLILLNNSFIYRDSLTNKSDKYLAFSLNVGGQPQEYFVVSGIGSNSDFKLVSTKGKNFNKIALDDAIEEELKKVGRLLFILVGKIDENISVEQEVKSDFIKKIVLNPTFPNNEIINDELRINDSSDEELVWKVISREFKGNAAFEEASEKLKAKIGTALDDLESESYSVLPIPKNINAGDKTVTQSLVEMLRHQLKEYRKALSLCDGDSQKNKGAYNDILRISYNYSSDALTFIRLIVSVCDLKPIVLWGTVHAHFVLSESFKALPWVRSKSKPSLANYSKIIGGARNSAFHNLFPFKRAIVTPIPGKSLKEVQLRIFSEFTRRKDNRLKFQDQELVDVLMEFTRTNEHKIPASFWQNNEAVIENTADLLEATDDFLRYLHKKV